MAKEVYKVEIPIIIEDKTDAPLKQAERKINRFERSAQKTNERIRRMFGREIKLRIAAVDRVWPIVMKIQSRLRGLTSRAWDITLRAKDKVTGVIKRMFRLLASPLTMLGAGTGLGALTWFPLKLSGEMEQAGIALEVLLGNSEAARKRLKELSIFAATTPFQFPQIVEASRILQVFGGDALATGNNLRLVGDIAAGTTRPFEEVALWMGRMYDAMKAGRPFGEATARLQEMGAISGEARARIETLAKSGQNIEKIWPQVIKEFGRFEGMTKRQSRSLLGLLSTLKDTFSIQILTRFGDGLRSVLGPKLQQLINWFDRNKETVEAWGEALERIARDVAQRVFSWGENLLNQLRKIFKSPGFEVLDWAGKFAVLLDEVSRTAIPRAIETGVKIGYKLGTGIASGIAKAAAEDLRFAAVLGVLTGTKIPGPLWFKIASGLTAAGGPVLYESGRQFIRERKDIAQTREWIEALKWAEKRGPVKGTTIGPARHATGGIFARPHVGLIADDGPEAIVPLALRWRRRAESILSNSGLIRPARVPAAVDSTGGITVPVVNMPTNITFNVKATDGKNILQVIRANFKTISDEISGEIASGLARVFQNMPCKK